MDILKRIEFYSNKDPVNLSYILKLAFTSLSESIISEQIDVTSDIKTLITRVSRDTQLRFQKMNEKLIYSCPHCGNKLSMNECALGVCFVCDEQIMLPVPTLKNICTGDDFHPVCISYKNGCNGPDDMDLEPPIIKVKRTGKRLPSYLLDTDPNVDD